MLYNGGVCSDFARKIRMYARPEVHSRWNFGTSLRTKFRIQLRLAEKYVSAEWLNGEGMPERNRVTPPNVPPFLRDAF